MIFWRASRRYSGASAVEVVRELERDAAAYDGKGGAVRDFIEWALQQQSDCLPARELAVSDKVNDETLALSFLCLLDQYELGELDSLPNVEKKRRAESSAK